MAGILPNDAAEQFNRRDLIAMCDDLADDQLAARRIYLAVSGLQDLGVNPRDLEAISVMIRRLARGSPRAGRGAARGNRHALRRGGAPQARRGYWHRDSQLQDAWKEWQAGMRAYKECEESESDQRYDAVTMAERKIEEMHACTPLGLAVKLRYLFHELEVSPATQDALVYGEPVTDDLLQCPRQRLGWSVVQIAERLARPAGSI